jgi:hypothetical protein
MVVDTVKQKWVSPETAGFLVTFRFTPRTRFRSRVPCDCGNLSGAVSGLMRAVGGDFVRQIAFLHMCGELPTPVTAGRGSFSIVCRSNYR